MLQPGDSTAHVDTFARDGLPPRALWPTMDYSVLPELAAYPDRINAAAALLDATAKRSPDRPVVHYGPATWTYAELLARSNRIARYLTGEMALRPGNRVLLRCPNTPMLMASWLAVLRAGGICVATMPLLRARELATIIEKARVSHAICDLSLAHELTEAREGAGDLRSVAYVSAEGTGDDPKADLDRGSARGDATFEHVATAADDIALLAFTSGTTGRPKATVHFHRDVLAMCDIFPRQVLGARADDVYLGTPPLAFTFGLGALLGFPMRSGASVVFPTERPTPESLLDLVQRKKCTALFTAPKMFRLLAEAASDFDISSLRECVSAGETLPLPIFEAFRKATGLRVIDGLGSTEMIHIFVATAGDDIRPGATGKAVPGYQARVMDDAGLELPAGEIGQLAVRGPTGCRYLLDEQRQREYVRDGWNYPGDMYRRDSDGYFWYQARADDMIIAGGYNIAGPEVEAALLEHQKVADCAVVAAPDGVGGHTVKAFIVLRNPDEAGDEVAEELKGFVKRQIAPYKYPRLVTFLETLPRTETGKVQRFKLREASRKERA